MTHTNARSGFSLIEIVIAVTIMGLVAAVIVPNVISYLKRAKRQTTNVALKTVGDAIELYRSDTGSYPASLSDLIISPVDEKLAKRWEGPYWPKHENPTDAWKNDLVYVPNAKGAQPPYELYSYGPNGEGSPSEEWIHARDV